MAAISSIDDRPARRLRRYVWLAAVPALPALVAIASWWFTEPLVDEPAPVPDETIVTVAALDEPTGPVSWPEGRLDGRDAKIVMLEILADVSRRVDRMQGYTATFKKQERVNGKLLPEQTMAMKVRQRPFAIYFKFLAPKPGKEVVYAEGHHGNKVIAHNGDWTRRLVPRLAVEPTSPVALADNRHPITDAGISKLAHKLIAFRKLDLEDDDAETILDRIPGPDGRAWPRSVHLHKHRNESRPFIKVEVLYDPSTLFPLQITSFDWPEANASGELPLAERYVYENLAIDPPLTAVDFDPANPKYEFLRF
jgi:hypothetical protein